MIQKAGQMLKQWLNWVFRDPEVLPSGLLETRQKDSDESVNTKTDEQRKSQDS